GGRVAGGRAPPPRGMPFVGRSRHLEALHGALAAVRDGRTVVLRVHGRSGAGKSFLVQRFGEEVSEGGVVVLAGRCYEQEAVPYKAFDSLIDGPGRPPRRLPPPEAPAPVPPDIAALRRS